MAEAALPDLVLQLTDIHKSYATGSAMEIEVLHGINLGLRRGEFSALIGPSGSGKSTLLNLIGLLDRPSRGRLCIDGQETGRLDDRTLTRLRGRRIGFVFQHHHLISAFSALENVMMPMLVERGRPDDEMRQRAATLLEQVGLSAQRHNKANQMSGGQQQRVAIARALTMRPSLVLADEPTGNLDTQSADSVFALMREINAVDRTTFLVVTHDARLAARCDRVVELVDGKVVSDTAPRR